MKNIKNLARVIINSVMIVSGVAVLAVGIEGIHFQIVHHAIDSSSLLIAAMAITGVYCTVAAFKRIWTIFEKPGS